MQGPDSIASPLLRQAWRDVAFVHWRTDAGQIAPLLPAGVVPEEFDGSAWVGLVAFRIEDTVSRGVPLPFGDFPETNVRVYVRDSRGRQGVVFLSLDASSLPAVVAARVWFGLPYVWARMRVSERNGVYSYLSRRHSSPRGAPDSVLRIRPLPEPVDDPLSDFLTARWALFSSRAGRTIRLPNDHEPWPIQRAELVELQDSLVARAGIYGVHDRAPDSVLFSPGVHTVFGRPSVLAGTVRERRGFAFRPVSAYPS